MFPLKAFGVVVLGLGVVTTASPLTPAGTVSAAGLVTMYALTESGAFVKQGVLSVPLFGALLALCALAAVTDDYGHLVSAYDPTVAPQTLAATASLAAPAYVLVGPMGVPAVTAGAIVVDAALREYQRFREYRPAVGAAMGALARATGPLVCTSAVLLLFVVAT
ncbi:hypothetical protein [Halarchaeum sp. P4]|uniref:hypothetical protein n=1 Tax=Halarchaeum sp. P4 TaxID=3421639 RepID=UPI003EB7CCB6